MVIVFVNQINISHGITMVQHELEVDRHSFTKIERISNIQVVYFQSNQTLNNTDKRCAIAWTRIKSNSRSGTILILNDEFEIFSMRLLQLFQYTIQLTNGNISYRTYQDDKQCRFTPYSIKVLLNITQTDLLTSTICIIDRQQKCYQCLKCCRNGNKLIWEEKKFHSSSSNRFFSLYYLICLTTGMHFMRVFLQLFYSDISSPIIREKHGKKLRAISSYEKETPSYQIRLFYSDVLKHYRWSRCLTYIILSIPYMSICIQSIMNPYSINLALPFCLLGCLSIGGCIVLTNWLRLTTDQITFINNWLRNYEGNSWYSIHRWVYLVNKRKKEPIKTSISCISQPEYCQQRQISPCNRWCLILRTQQTYWQVLLAKLNDSIQDCLHKSKVFKIILKLLLSTISFLFGHFLFATFPFQLIRLIQPTLARYGKSISSLIIAFIITFSFVTPFFFSIIIAHMITTTAIILPYIKFFLPYIAIIIVIVYFIYCQLTTYFDDRLTIVKVLHEIRQELQSELLCDSHFFTKAILKFQICDALPKANDVKVPKSLTNVMIRLIIDNIEIPESLHSFLLLEKHACFYMRITPTKKMADLEASEFKLDILCNLKSTIDNTISIKNGSLCKSISINQLMKTVHDYNANKEMEDFIASWLGIAYYNLSYGIVAVPVKLHEKIVKLYPGCYYNVSHLILHIILLVIISMIYFSSILIFDNLKSIDSYVESATTFLITYVSVFAGVKCGNGIKLNEYQLRKAFKMQVIKYIACMMNRKKF
ncbi:hypothetical protein TrispH2_003990 [Trichoplax sp. H2]|nr:hypothetical protein TrispH2_003990 [Trichoplax sp. H2]|eukprot:RDD43390.1 hypothetical protein TrispH2_003990 [Trichoplax sp. H2]